MKCIILVRFNNMRIFTSHELFNLYPPIDQRIDMLIILEYLVTLYSPSRPCLLTTIFYFKIPKYHKLYSLIMLSIIKVHFTENFLCVTSKLWEINNNVQQT